MNSSEHSLHVEATRASNIHEIAVRGLNESLQLVLLSLFISSGITEIVDLYDHYTHSNGLHTPTPTYHIECSKKIDYSCEERFVVLFL